MTRKPSGSDRDVITRPTSRSRAGEEQLRYWREHLRGAPSLIELPTDRPRPSTQSCRTAACAFALTPAVSDALRSLARDQEATPFMVLLAGLQTLLYRYTRQEDLLVGAPGSHGDTDNFVGPGASFLALRGDLSGDPTFVELCGRTRDTAMAAYAHQDFSFEALLAELSLERSLAHAPLFQIVLELESWPVDPSHAGPDIEPPSTTSPFDLTFSLTDRRDGIAGVIHYATDLFDEATVTRMSRHFGRLLEGALADPERRISTLPLLSETERHALLVDLNATEREFPEQRIHEMIERRAAEAPDRTAVVLEGHALSYGQLNARANQLAHHLRGLGIGPGSIVGVATERSFEMSIALLAVVKAGAAYLPVDPGYPKDRIELMISDARPRIVLTQDHLVASLPEGAPLLALDAGWPDIANEPTHNPGVAISPQDIIYVIYTSGSTGRPKGVLNTHTGVENHMHWFAEYFGISADDRFIHKTPFSFDSSFWELFLPLMHGAQLVMAKPGGHQDPRYLAEVIATEAITITQFVPSMLAVLLEADGVEGITHLRHMIVGGEAVPNSVVRRYRERLPGTLHSLYGQTEAADDATVHVCGTDEPAIVPIGKPISNVQLYVLDPHLEPMPPGVAGEIYVGGAGLARGYHERPGLTAERFIPNPFSSKAPGHPRRGIPGARLYRTGDLGRVRADGVIEFVGRTDHQVKLRGLRIELGEVEAALGLHPGVREVIAMVREDTKGDQRLVAYLVPSGEPLDSADLRAHLRGRLPEYMVPSAFVMLEALPLTPNRKVDRKALPAPEPQAATEYLVPRTPTEQTIAYIFGDILHIATVGALDDFFTLGGHSLLATQVVSRVRSELGVDLQLRVLFEQPTVELYATAIDAAGDTSPANIDPIAPVPRDQPLAPSFAQERLWFLDQLEPGSPLYNVPEIFHLRGALDVGALERALGAIVARHEVLRTTFARADDRPVQVIAPHLPLKLARVDLCGFSDGERLAEARRLASADARRPFDLASGPLIRTTLLALAPDEHWLLLSMHHVVTDGWSYGVLWEELGIFYEAFCAGREPELAPLAIQYADFAAWQRQTLAGDVTASHLDYWRHQLAGAPSLLELPSDRPRPPAMSYRGATHTFKLPASLVAGLQGLSRAESATLFMTLLAAFQTLLHRYSGQDDILVGSPVANRNHADIEPLIGFFVNTLVLRGDLSGDPTFLELLGRVREAAFGAYAHQDLPFEKLVEELNPDRSLSYSPLFQVMFVLQNAPLGPAMRGLEHTPVALHNDTSMFDLTLTFEERNGQLDGTFEYSTDLFDPSTIERMTRHLERLLVEIVKNPARAISELALLDDAEVNALVVKLNDNARDFPSHRRIHEMIEDRAAEAPERIAVVLEDQTLTYGELDARANQLAHHLQGLGAGPGALVGVAMERSFEMSIALVAVLKTGAAYVPIDAEYPRDRIELMIADARPSVVLIQDRLRGVLPPGAPVLAIDAEWDDIARQPADALGVHIRPEDAIYVIYTSGSTGRPKGAINTYRAVENHMAFLAEYLAITAADRIIQKTAFSFDASFKELFLPLMYGARLVMARPGGHQDPDYLARVLADGGITIAQFVPSMLALLLEAPGLEGCTTMRHMIAGGEVLPSRIVKRYYERLPGALHNFYGQTEAADDAICHQCDPDEPATVPVGRPIANVTAYVLDGQLRPVAHGVVGEIYIGGAAPARCYLHRPALTAERFIPDPFSATPGARLYKTGDLGRVRTGGQVEIVGRVDHQVKLRGMRMELGEIEAQLARHALVREAVVIVREDRPGDQRLVAYVVVAGAEVDLGELRTHLKGRLPEYMVPSAFVVLEELPLTPNGKVDRKALPAPATLSEIEYVAPRTATETAVAEMFSEVLGVAKVGATDHFFELGGHSLLATQVVARTRARFGVELQVRTLFEEPTVAALAARIEAARASDGDSPAMVPVPRDGDLALSFAQERLWFLEQLEPGSPLYNVPEVLELRGAVDVEALERALNAVVARHEALRTTFASRDGRPVQVIAPSLTIDLLRVDLCDVPAKARRAEAETWLREDARRPFDLQRGPLLRTSLLALGADHHWLAVTMHHIVTDGWSTGVLLDELATLYAAYRDGRAPALPALAIQYADFAAWQRTWLSGPVLDEQLGYWKQQLDGVPALLELPADRPRPPVMTYRGAGYKLALPASLTEGLHEIARAESATLFMVLLAAFQALLYRYSGQNDILVGSPVANRNREETEGLIGFFVNTLVLRGDLAGDPTFHELLARVREAALGAYAHQDIPFEKVVEALNPDRSLGYSPLFQVMFVLQNAPGSPTLPGLEHRFVDVDGGTSKFDLTLILEEHDGALSGVIEYATDLFDEATITRMADHFERVLAEVVRDRHQRVATLPLLGAAEYREVVEVWSGTTSPVPDRCVHELFEDRVDEAPDAIAVAFEGEEVTYRELDRRANQVANHLRKLGVARESLVGIAVERSIDMVVGLLAILKAGGAYVPLDPAYPAERLQWMAEDAGVTVLVTQAKLAKLVPGSDARRVLLDDPGLASETTERPPTRGAPADLAYIDFTSGSTGRPKGVCVAHRSIARLVLNTSYIDISPDDVFLQLSPIAFDASTFEIWGPLLSGAKLVVMPPEPPSLEALGRTIAKSRVTVLWLTAGLFHQMVDHRLQDLAGVRCLLAGGDVLSVPHVRRVIDELSATTLINGYGPTENTTFTCCYPVPRPMPAVARVPIGRPIANTSVYILDEGGNPVPIGVPGELYTGGDGLARGYLHRPGLTGERFVPNAFGEGRLYRTGDRARWRAGGTIDFLGRIDQQIKLRGFRIELGEIEAALVTYPGVREAIAVVRDDLAGGKQLVAYLVAPDRDVDAQAVRAWLKGKLPSFMVPAAMVTLDALPLTPNGKVDRKALPAPAADTGAAYVAPRTPTEQTLAHIFAGVLGIQSVGIHDDFFLLGGHSLLATQIMSRVRTTFGIEHPLRALFEDPTVARLAARIDAASGRESTGTAAAITRARRCGALDLSFAQERLWFLDQLEPGSPLYNVPWVVELRGHLDGDALEHALTALAARHEALRTTFSTRDGRPVQVIAPIPEVTLARIDLCGLPDGERREEARRRAADEARRPFDLERGPLIRAAVFALGPEQHWLVVTIHHIVTDGWSMDIFATELSELYEAYASGREPALAPLGIQYADFAAWQRTWLSGEVLDAQLDYWKQHLAGAPSLLELATDRPRPATLRYRGAVQPFRLSAALSDALRAMTREQSATLFMSLLAAFQVLLGRQSGQDDILVGSPVANRNREETEGLIGFFVNTLVMRGDLSGDPTFCELLARVREAALGAYAHQDVPFEKLVEVQNPDRSRSYSPLFQVMFVLQNAPVGGEMAGLDPHAIDLYTGTAKFDLTLEMEDGPDGLAGTFEYDTDLFDSETITRMVGHFERLLEEIAADPGRRISELPMMGEAERRQLVVTWNDTARTYSPAPVHERIEAQAKSTPDAIAVEFEGDHITYRELVDQANQLAHRLIEEGVEPDVLVGVAIERSIPLVVSLLAILKAGGAFVPLDPGYPEDRLTYMISDAQPRVLLTRAGLCERLAAAPATRVLVIEKVWPQLRRQPVEPPHVTVAPANLAYVIYTSGSTGRPKGAMNTHAGIANRLDWMQEAYGLGAADRVLQKTPFSFDVSVWEFFWPLMTGARLVVAKPEGHKDPAYLVDTIAKRGVTTMHFVPSMLAVFLDAQNVSRCTSLRHVVSSGEALPYELVVRFHRALGAQLHNLYGPTEAAVDVSHFTCERKGPPVVPIGRPIANLRLYVLDPNMEPVPIGSPGEVHIGGIGVGRGYLRRPGLTAERFVPDPFAPEPGGRLYKTGDLGRVRGDGSIEYLGRIDHQVKLRGFRIELGEIETVLMSHPSVHGATVIVRQVGNDQGLVAYVVAARGQAAEPAALRGHLKVKLPEYMVPSAFVMLAKLPLTPNGKIDRKALPAPEVGPIADYVAPRTPAELSLAQIFADVLKVPAIGIHDDFFLLGGHSLLAVQLIAVIEERLGTRLPVAALFGASTVAALAREIEPGERAPSQTALIPLRARGQRPPLVCIHPGGGTIFCYQALVSRLAPDRPVFGLVARGLAAGESPAESVEDMAKAYVSAVVGACPGGPVHLMGWSFGGLVALEMTRLLCAAGHDVASTTMIDTMAPSLPMVPERDVHPMAMLAAFAQDLGIDVDEEELVPLAPEDALARVVALGKKRGHIPSHLGADEIARRVLVFSTNARASARYAPPNLDGKIVLIRAADQSAADDVNPAEGWSRIFPHNLEVREAPGTHYTMVIPPHVDVLARHLDDTFAAR